MTPEQRAAAERLRNKTLGTHLFHHEKDLYILADYALTLMADDGEPVYRIKPLEWTRGNNPTFFTACAIGISYSIDTENGVVWGYCKDEYYDETSGIAAATLEDAKAAAEAHYRERILCDLIPTKP